MNNPALAHLISELGAAASELPDLSHADPATLEALAQALAAAKTRQRAQIAESSEQALSFIPALLRGAVRRALF